ncbi:MAG: His Kinase (phospho-acceptor) domain [Candidatus Paceibacter sp.]|jgi:signal transduction histidine kinase|nr:His Kinase (phospho-acceptor) domain [Candidatus Paceibacter sp.]
MPSQPISKEVLSRLTHDLKNPIAAIQLFTEMLQKGVGGPLSDQQKQMIDEIEKSNQNLSKIIADFRSEFMQS